MKSSRRAVSQRRLCVRCEHMFDSAAELDAHLLTHHKNSSRRRKPQKENKQPVAPSTTPRSPDAPEIVKKEREGGGEKKRGRRRMDYKNGFGLPTGGSYIEGPRAEGADEPSAGKSTWKPFVCLSCPFRTRHVSSLRAHIAVMHKAWSFSCSECDTRFALATALRQHERSVHPEALARRLQEEAAEAAYRCEDCEAVFESHRAMKLHARKHRTKAKETFCEICQRAFCSAYAFNRHRKVVHERSVPKEVLLCEVCGRRCATKYTLKAHVAQHGDRRFECRKEGCSSSFSSSSALSLHLRRTHSERQFSCASCNLSFRYRSVLEQHRRTKHGAMPGFTCPTCGRTLRHPASRRRHMRTHLRSKEHRCNLCDFKCHEKSSLKRHIKFFRHQKSKPRRKEPKPRQKSRLDPAPSVPLTLPLSLPPRPKAPQASVSPPPASSQPPPASVLPSQPPPASVVLTQLPPASVALSQPPPDSAVFSEPPPASVVLNQLPPASIAFSQPPPASVALSQPPPASVTFSQSSPAPTVLTQLPPPSIAFSQPPPAPVASSEPPLSSATPLPSFDFLTGLQAPLQEPDPEACPFPSRSLQSAELLVFNCETNKTELIQTNRLWFDGQNVVLLPAMSERSNEDTGP